MIKTTLLYPPQQSHPEHGCKPEASLAYPYLAGALLDAGHDVAIYDACVGNDNDDEDVFHQTVELSSGLQRHGVSDERILEEVADSDIVGITSTFTAQETMAVSTGQLIKQHYPEKLLVVGGINATCRQDVFLAAGFDIVCLAEAERSLVQIADHPTRMRRGKAVEQVITTDLDELPMPAWHLHANDRYWRLGRPHGAAKQNGQPFRYASMMTSRGCVFRCKYCHISGEKEAAKFRVKSIPRVQSELQQLDELGAEDIFIEDDTLFGYKRRAVELLQQISRSGVRLWGINGINLPHLFCRSAGRFRPDAEVLDTLEGCHFAAVSLPVESASQRIINYYASRKWQVDQYRVEDLITALADRGIAAGVNYMIGYPDETLEEIRATIAMARRHLQAGAASANFMLVIPLPGTSLHQYAIDHGYLDGDFNPDTFNWRQASMTNTTVPPAQLEEIHAAAWEELNP